MQGARLEGPGPRGVALTLDNAMASSFRLSEGFTANGTVRLPGTRVTDDVTFAGAVLNGPPAEGMGDRQSVARRVAWNA
ncbi:hypothetical protein GCM10010129_43630 [Streptomyces fumigatiscleroticus]|nr:hypothetical protein GCM10010129_43630 [Streptomyces fumigatiscleroticus]